MMNFACAVFLALLCLAVFAASAAAECACVLWLTGSPAPAGTEAAIIAGCPTASDCAARLREEERMRRVPAFHPPAGEAS